MKRHRASGAGLDDTANEMRRRFGFGATNTGGLGVSIEAVSGEKKGIFENGNNMFGGFIGEAKTAEIPETASVVKTENKQPAAKSTGDEMMEEEL